MDGLHASYAPAAVGDSRGLRTRLVGLDDVERLCTGSMSGG